MIPLRLRLLDIHSVRQAGMSRRASACVLLVRQPPSASCVCDNVKGMSCVEIASVAASEMANIPDQLADVYRGAFTAAPHAETEADVRHFVSETLPRHAARDGFRLVVARERPDGPVVGFVYGYRGAPGQWWYDIVSSALGTDLTARWMADYFELVTLAVAPSAQGRGIGGRLHDTILQKLPYRTALLTTLPAETPALRLYRNRGWQVVRENFHFPGGERPVLVMGLELTRGE